MIKRFFLALVLVFFLITRIYKIAEIPGSVYWDEASIGYNAFSIATDLKDEWGEFLPLHFRAFGEFKLPVYIYSVAVMVKMFGLNEYAVRLPAVFYSLGTVILVYLLTKKITKKESVAILSAFILSVSPWFFIFSRTGYEATAGLFFFLLAIFVFMSEKKRSLVFPLTAISLVLSMYSYTSFRIISPLFFLIFTVLEIKSGFRKNALGIIFSLGIFAASMIPAIRLFIYDAGFGRAQSFALIPSIQQVYDLSGKPHLQITFNRTAGINWWQNALEIGKNLAKHFSYDFLFKNGDSNPRSQIPGHGELYFFDIPFLLLGFYAALKRRNKEYLLPIFILAVSSIPAAITKESPHALRAILAAPAFAIIAAVGVGYLASTFKKYSAAIFILAAIGYYFSFESYAVYFITKYNSETAKEWQYQYKKIFSGQKSGEVTDEYGQPYIFGLYYLKYPPEKFRSEVKLNPVDRWGFSKVKSFGEYEFK